MRPHQLFYSSVRNLGQALLVGVAFALVVWVMLAMRTGFWLASLREALPLSAAPALVLAALAGPLKASDVRYTRNVPAMSSPSMGLALFASVWAAFWVLPFNLVIFAKHGIVRPLQENLMWVVFTALAGACLSFVSAKAQRIRLDRAQPRSEPFVGQARATRVR